MKLQLSIFYEIFIDINEHLTAADVPRISEAQQSIIAQLHALMPCILLGERTQAIEG